MRPKLLLARMHASEVRENGEIDRHGQRVDKIIQGDASGRGQGRVDFFVSVFSVPLYVQFCLG